jgi:MFS superfamily sulfate permease-like transporter
MRKALGAPRRGGGPGTGGVALPSDHAPHIIRPDTSHWPELLHGSAVVTIVGFSLVIATGKTFAEKHGYEVDPNQELLAVGTANILGGLVCCYPASSSLSRSALANAAGAQTPAFNFFAVSG